MVFTFIVLATALFIEAIGTYISVLGLSALFAGSAIVTVMAVSLDIGKVVAVSFLYKHWKNLSFLMRSYMLISTMVLMIITSSGVFGYLSGEFQKAMTGNSQQTVAITALEEEQTRLQKRKEEIDAMIANLPANSVRGRTKLAAQFKDETTRINERLATIDQELPKMKMEIIGQSVKIGPIIYIAQAFDTTPEQAVKWIILIIIGVFDPLAVVLLIAGNYLLEQRKKPQAAFPSSVGVEFPSWSDYVPPTPQTVQPASPGPAVAEAQEVTTVENKSDDVNLELVPLDTPEKHDDIEVITLSQLKKPASASPVASSLESLDPRFSSDIVEVMGDRITTPQGLQKKYAD